VKTGSQGKWDVGNKREISYMDESCKNGLVNWFTIGTPSDTGHLAGTAGIQRSGWEPGWLACSPGSDGAAVTGKNLLKRLIFCKNNISGVSFFWYNILKIPYHF
jgi:hypothetical protein